MPKAKTHKGMKKRFKVTASGKAKCRSAYRGHLLSHKSSKRKRQNRNDVVLVKADAKMICDALRAAGR
jgi:large subunit ribosomal protein L35